MTTRVLSKSQFRNRLLDIMDRKHHWAWPFFMGTTLAKAQLRLHFQQEYAVYVRDFPVFLARIHSHNPPAEVRGMLAENIYEEDTGRLSLGTSHPELFLIMMEGLGFKKSAFEKSTLLPASLHYRKWLNRVASDSNWILGAAVLTIFVEGSVQDRREISHPSRGKTRREIETYVKRHPLVQHHGLSLERMDLIRAHQMVESGHRQDAYRMVVNYARDRANQDAVFHAMNRSLELWLRYRDGVARACGLSPT